MARKKSGGGGAPEWMVTFGDLMSILVCFFVLLISFSIQDKQKMQVVAGSMKDAFGIQPMSKKAGMIEFEGVPVRENLKQLSTQQMETNTDFSAVRHDDKTKQGPEANTHEIERTDIERPRQFALAAASLRQAWKELPEIHELSDNIMVEDTPEGLHIQLVDQEGRSMFNPDDDTPFERTRLLLEKMVPVLKQMPNRIVITGHTDAAPVRNRPGYSRWDVSADRAKATRRILANAGLSDQQIHSVAGKADTEPLFPEDPTLPGNRRISILLMSEAPPLPQDHRP